MYRIFIISLIGLQLLFAAGYAQETQITPDVEAVRADVYYLASDELEGRFPGTPGIEVGAEYIAQSFGESGLVPACENGTSYYQNFEMTTKVEPGENNSLSISTPDGTTDCNMDTDFIPLFLSANGEIEADVVFAGYGITSPEYGWDDYEAIDATGKIVLCFRSEPGEDDPSSLFNGKYPTQYAGIRYKAENAVSHGAVGLILVSGPNNLAEGEVDELISLDTFDGFGESSIPVIHVSQNTASMLVNVMGAPLAMFQSEMDRNFMAFGSGLEGVSAHIIVRLERIRVQTKNVIGILPGINPALSDQYVVIGAHYDHIGWGGIRSKDNSGIPVIHNGADDNASGTSGVLELARMFACAGPRSRSIVFACFSAEEFGALGSRYFIDNPPIPLEKINVMINMDMIGRMQRGGDGIPYCTVQGTGSAVGLSDLVSELSTDFLKLIVSPDPIGGSDYMSFLAAGIPYLNFFTGVHEDYHSAGDDADKIDYHGISGVISVVYHVTEGLANMPFRLSFNIEQAEENTSGGGVDAGIDFSVYFGTVPDFSRTEGGFWISGVNSGSPAEAAGLLPGDQIIRLGEYEVSDIYNYTYALGRFQPGDTTEVVVIRDGMEIPLTVTFASRE